MAQDTPRPPLRLNLGSGQNPRPGYVNVDKFGSPDLTLDLEQFPWPWPDDSVDEIVLCHVLEHLGQTIEIFFAVIKELYRVCRHGALIQITVPHPRHDSFLGDPTHVRPLTTDTFMLFSKANCRQWQIDKVANSPLALYLDVDFNISHLQLDLEQPWAAEFDAKRMTQEQLFQASRQFNNVIKQINIRWEVNKPAGAGSPYHSL